MKQGMYPVADVQAVRAPRPDFSGYPASRAVIVAVSSYLSGLERTFATGQVGNIFFPDAVDVTVLLLGVGATSLVSSGSSVITTADIFAVGNQANSALGTATPVIEAGVQVTGVQGTSVSGNDPYYSDDILLLHMDGANNGTTFIDNSPIPKAITANGNAVTSTTIVKYGTASALFDGSGDYLSTPTTTAFSFGTGAFTLECWVYISGNSNPNVDGNRIAAVFNSGFPVSGGPVNGWSLVVMGNSSTTGTGIALDVWISGVEYVAISSGTVSQGVWNHIAISRANASAPIIFLNGVAQTLTTSTITGTQNIVTTLANPTFVGRQNTTLYLDELRGRIDDLRITKGVARYTANFTPPTAPFIDGAYITGTANVAVTGVQGASLIGNDPYFKSVGLLLHMDGANGGTTFTDDSPSPKTVTPVGTAQTSTAIVKYGTASGVFNGSGARLTTASSSDFAFGTGDFTIEAWVYPLAAWSTYNAIFFTAVVNGVFFGKVSGGFGLRASEVADLISMSPPSTNTWTHVAVSRQGTNLRVFVNGVLGNTVTNNTNFVAGAASIAADSVGGASFNGHIDDLRITKGVARYTANFTPPTAAFVNGMNITTA